MNIINKLRDRQKGFTIIEVMIVLAIAGLIIAIVLVAIPQLQRNQRNTARNTDASRVGASVQNWVSRNNGTVFVAGTSNANLESVKNDVGNLNQFTLTSGTNFTVATGAGSALTALDTIVIRTGAKCGTDGVAVAPTGTSSRQFVVLYAEESGGSGGTVGRCIEY